jgi:ribonuclease HI
MKKVDIYTDGACSGNPGDGGWGVVLKYGSHEKEASGFEKNTTNNRMELTAAIKALEMLKEPCMVELYSDSAYMVNAFNKEWVSKWKSNGWVNAGNDEVKNIDLWERLYELSRIHSITWNKVKGHSDNEYNNRCDKLATGEIKKNRKELDNKA